MAKLVDVTLHNWNDLVGLFHDESDRGAAIVAASFVENYLGAYLRALSKNQKSADRLFDNNGPLATFSQRILFADAYGLLPPRHCSDLDIVRKVRNHFAHHPLDATFETESIKKLCASLSEQPSKDAVTEHRSRSAFLFSCGAFAIFVFNQIELKETKAP